MSPAASRPVALSPLHYRHVELGAEMELVDGWRRPVRYAPTDEELAAVRSGVGVCDVSPMGKLALLGDGLDELFSAVFPNSPPPSVGRTVRVDDGTTAARLARDEALVTTAGVRSVRLTAGAAGCAHVVDVTLRFGRCTNRGPTGARPADRLDGDERGPARVRRRKLRSVAVRRDTRHAGAARRGGAARLHPLLRPRVRRLHVGVDHGGRRALRPCPLRNRSPGPAAIDDPAFP